MLNHCSSGSVPFPLVFGPLVVTTLMVVVEGLTRFPNSEGVPWPLFASRLMRRPLPLRSEWPPDSQGLCRLSPGPSCLLWCWFLKSQILTQFMLLPMLGWLFWGFVVVLGGGNVLTTLTFGRGFGWRWRPKVVLTMLLLLLLLFGPKRTPVLNTSFNIASTSTRLLAMSSRTRLLPRMLLKCKFLSLKVVESSLISSLYKPYSCACWPSPGTCLNVMPGLGWVCVLRPSRLHRPYIVGGGPGLAGARRLPAPVVPMFSPSGRPLRRLVRKTTFKPAHCALARPGSSLPSPACSLPRGDGDGAVRGRDGQ